MIEIIRKAAIVTFLNILFLSLVCTRLDGIYAVTDSLDGFDQSIYYCNKMAQELSDLETLRTEFIANVSHELKIPPVVFRISSPTSSN